MTNLPVDSAPDPGSPKSPAPLNEIQRRILGVLMEKARTTPDTYPLSLNGLVTGCNQKSNRHPLLDLDAGQVEHELDAMRAAGVVAEVQGGSRVPKYRHYGYDYLQVKGAEAAVMTELLLRGEQSMGDLRVRASRFEPIADLNALHQIVGTLMERGLVIPLTPPGRGQLITHNLYLPEELGRLRQQLQTSSMSQTLSPASSPSPNIAIGPRAVGPRADADHALASEVAAVRAELRELQDVVASLKSRLDALEN